MATAIDIKKGQLVFIVKNDRGKKQELGNREVVKVAKKYFFVQIKDYASVKFCIKGYKQATNYTPDYILYRSRQEWLDETNHYRYKKLIMKKLEYCYINNVSLSSLKKIASILDIEIDSNLITIDNELKN